LRSIKSSPQAERSRGHGNEVGAVVRQPVYFYTSQAVVACHSCRITRRLVERKCSLVTKMETTRGRWTSVCVCGYTRPIIPRPTNPPGPHLQLLGDEGRPLLLVLGPLWQRAEYLLDAGRRVVLPGEGGTGVYVYVCACGGTCQISSVLSQ
jgi:hypothetical protein